MPYAMSFSLFMICAGLTLPRTSGVYIAHSSSSRLTSVFQDYSLFFYFLLWISFFAVSSLFIIIHGIDYVSWPRLLPPTDIIYYNGPGFRSGNKGKGLGIPALDVGTWSNKSRATLLAHKRGGSRLDEIEMGKKRVD